MEENRVDNSDKVAAIKQRRDEFVQYTGPHPLVKGMWPEVKLLAVRRTTLYGDASAIVAENMATHEADFLLHAATDIQWLLEERERLLQVKETLEARAGTVPDTAHRTVTVTIKVGDSVNVSAVDLSP